MATHDHPLVRGFWYLGKCWNGSNQTYPKGLHDRSCEDYGDEGTCTKSGTSCSCEHPGGSLERKQKAADVEPSYYKELNESVDFLISLIGEDTPEYWSTNVWDCDAGEFRYGFVIGALAAAAELRFYDQFERTVTLEEQQEIIKLLESKVSVIKQKLTSVAR